MSEREGSGLTSSREAMAALWDEHMRSEFATHSVEETLDTMVSRIRTSTTCR